MTNENKILIKINMSTFEKQAVLAASHKFTDNYYVQLNDFPENSIEVSFKQKDKTQQLSGMVLEEFMNELLDQQMRVIVERECGKMRDLIVEKAFFPFNNYQ